MLVGGPRILALVGYDPAAGLPVPAAVVFRTLVRAVGA